MPDNLRKILVDGLTVETTDQGAQAIEKLTKQLADALSGHDKTIGAKDAEIADLKKDRDTKDGEIAALKKKVEDASSPAAIADAVRARSLAVDAGKKAGIADMDKMTDAEIRRAVVVKSLGDSAKDMSDDAISGAFTYASHNTTDAAALGSGVPAPTHSMSDADKAYNESTAHMRDAWKGEKGAH